MGYEWELVESGPADATRTVLLFPGGLCRARSYAEVMAHPALAGERLVAATLPGHCGTPAPEDFSIGYAAELGAKLANDLQCDALVGFSTGATVAYEMVVSGAWSGPLILLGVSLSLRDEPAFLRVMDRLAVVTGSLPFAMMRQMMGSMAKHLRVPDARRAELLDDLRSNDPKTMRHIFRGYVAELGRDDAPATRLCDSRAPTWIVHAEKGDGGLTNDERDTLEHCATTSLITTPGTSWMLPCEEPDQIAELICTATGS
jgi:pimeloyl-ACP methyl ester carboxylesterase